MGLLRNYRIFIKTRDNMKSILKGNFKPKNEVVVGEKAIEGGLKEEFRKKAIENIGGSMVFVERDLMTWKPDKK